MNKLKRVLNLFRWGDPCNKKDRDKLIVDYWNATDTEERESIIEKMADMIQCVLEKEKNCRESSFGCYTREEAIKVARKIIFKNSPSRLEKEIDRLKKEIERLEERINRLQTLEETETLKTLRKQLKEKKHIREQIKEKSMRKRNSWNDDAKRKAFKF